MNQEKCPLCQSSDFTKYWAFHGYRLSRCLRCFFVWDPFPQDNVLSQYEKNYYVNDNPKGGYANYFEGMRINRKTFASRLRRISRKTGYKSDLLDVGSALGDCLVEAQKLKWSRISGIEPSHYAAAFARDRGFKVINGILSKKSFKSNSFNIVTSQDVLEHIGDPLPHLDQIFRVLKPQGWLFLVTPDIGGVWHFFLRSLWYHYKPGEHISYFSKSNLKKSLAKAGFTNIEIWPTYHIMSLEYILNRCQYYSPFIFGNLLRLVKKTSLKDLAFHLYTGEMEAWAQKPKS